MWAARTQALSTMCSTPIMSTWASPTAGPDPLDSFPWRSVPPVAPLPPPTLSPPSLLSPSGPSPAVPTTRPPPLAGAPDAPVGIPAASRWMVSAAAAAAPRPKVDPQRPSSRRLSRRLARRGLPPAAPRPSSAPVLGARVPLPSAISSPGAPVSSGAARPSATPKGPVPASSGVGPTAPVALVETPPVSLVSSPGPVVAAAPAASPARSRPVTPPPILPYTSGLSLEDILTNLPPARRLFDDERSSSPLVGALRTSWAGPAAPSPLMAAPSGGSLKRGAASSAGPPPSPKRTRMGAFFSASPSSGLSPGGSYEQSIPPISVFSRGSSPFLADLSGVLVGVSPQITPSSQQFIRPEPTLTTPPPLDVSSPRPVSPVLAPTVLPTAERAFLRDLLGLYNNCRGLIQRWPEAPDFSKWF